MAELVSDELWNRIEPLLPPLPPILHTTRENNLSHRHYSVSAALALLVAFAGVAGCSRGKQATPPASQSLTDPRRQRAQVLRMGGWLIAKHA